MPVTLEALDALFPTDELGNQAAFEFDEGIHKFTGTVVRRDFRGLAVPDRQKIVWDFLRGEFGEEAVEISLVLTYTPEEWNEVGNGNLRAAG